MFVLVNELFFNTLKTSIIHRTYYQAGGNLPLTYLQFIKMKKKHLFFLTLMMHISYCSNAQNIVPNYSFEEEIDTTYCSWMGNDINGSCYEPRIEDFLSDWFQPSFGTSDIYNETKDPGCFASTYSTDPYAFGHQSPLTKQNYAGIATYTGIGVSSYREYIGVQLHIEIFPNIKYDCQMSVSLGDYCDSATNNIGMALTDSLINFCDLHGVLDIPTAVNSSDVILNDTSWHTIRDTVTLADEASYLYIGNFLPTSSTTVVSHSGDQPAAYYYIEDVIITPVYDSIIVHTICGGDSISFSSINGNDYSVYDMNSFDLLVSSNTLSTYLPTSSSIYMQVFDGIAIKHEVYIGDYLPTIDLGLDTVLCQGDTLTLDAAHFNVDYLWQDNSTASTFDVSQQGNYWVQLTNSCGSVSDTINVSLLPDNDILCQGEITAIDEYEHDKIKFEYFPNPASSEVTVILTGLANGQGDKFEIVDNLGRVHTTTTIWADEPLILSIENLAKGIYFLKLNTERGLIVKKLIIQ